MHILTTQKKTLKFKAALIMVWLINATLTTICGPHVDGLAGRFIPKNLRDHICLGRSAIVTTLGLQQLRR